MFEVAIVCLSILACMVALYVYGDGTNFQSAFYLFSAGILSSQLTVIFLLKKENSINRLQRWLLVFGGICGAGIVAMSGFVILSSQG